MLLYLQRNQVRTQMPRQSRKRSSTGIYHVMLRGINKQDIFEEAEDYVRMKELLTYDNLNRLSTATYGEQTALTTNSGRYTEQVTSYSPNSAITALKRYGKMQNNNFGLIDDLTMTFNGNQITQIADAATPVLYSGSFEFRDNTVVTNGTEYGYDGCGAMTWDANKGIAKIDYDLFGMPVRIQFTNGHVTEHVYTSEGEKLKTIHRTAVPNISISVNSTLTLNGSNTLSVDSTDYIGSFVFEQGTLNKYLFAGGYFTLSGGTPVYHYYTPDHLGNNRAVVNQSGTIEQITHYYPFGSIIADLSSGQDVQPYKYNGKELDRMHGLDWYDYGARNYDAAVGSWPTMDPLAEKYYSMSPYNYCGNNPIKYIDINGDSIIVDNYGNLIGQNGKDKNVYLYSKKSNKYSKIGVLGGTIDVQKILPNALRKNASEARKLKKNLFADFAFIQKVKTGGDWDLKKNDKTIFGIDNKTRFLFNNSLMSGEDIGNMNYGVVSKAFGYSEEYAKRGAGLYQIIEGHSKPEWRSNRTSITSYRANQFGIVSSITISVIGPPYGDDPHDQYWIDQGYQFK